MIQLSEAEMRQGVSLKSLSRKVLCLRSSVFRGVFPNFLQITDYDDRQSASDLIEHSLVVLESVFIEASRQFCEEFLHSDTTLFLILFHCNDQKAMIRMFRERYARRGWVVIQEIPAQASGEGEAMVESQTGAGLDSAARAESNGSMEDLDTGAGPEGSVE